MWQMRMKRTELICDLLIKLESQELCGYPRSTLMVPPLLTFHSHRAVLLEKANDGTLFRALRNIRGEKSDGERAS